MEDRRRVVLIVEDDDSVRRMMIEILSLLGSVDCIGAPSAAEALRLVGETAVDAMVLDDHLGLDRGTDLYQKAIAIEPRLRGRVLVTSGKAGEFSPESFCNSENIPFIQKPFPIDDFISAVGGLLAGR